MQLDWGNLAIGLLFGGGRGAFAEFQRQQQMAQQAAQAAQVRGLLGAPAQYDPGLNAGPPPPDQAVAQAVPGSGLLGNPNDPANRMQFAAGIMGIPGLEGLGANVLQSIYAQQQQERQFQQGEGRAASQFETMRQDRAAEGTQAQTNWQAQFDAQRAAEAERLRIAQAQLGMEQGRYRMAVDAATAARTPQPAELPKPIAGYGWTVNNGRPVMAPLPGSPDYAKAVGGLESLNEGLRQVDTILNTVWGQPRQVGGRQVRVGGTGFEAFGSQADTLALAYGNLRSAILRAQESGVIDKGEREAFSEMLANPKSWTGIATEGSKNAYESVKGQLQRKLDAYYQANPWLIPEAPIAQPGGPARGAAGAAAWMPGGRQ
jgi:hypothetical protein